MHHRALARETERLNIRTAERAPCLGCNPREKAISERIIHAAGRGAWKSIKSELKRVDKGHWARLIGRSASGPKTDTALHEAAKNGHPITVAVLILADADPDQENEDGFTPVALAITFSKYAQLNKECNEHNPHSLIAAFLGNCSSARVGIVDCSITDTDTDTTASHSKYYSRTTAGECAPLSVPIADVETFVRRVYSTQNSEDRYFGKCVALRLAAKSKSLDRVIEEVNCLALDLEGVCGVCAVLDVRAGGGSSNPRTALEKSLQRSDDEGERIAMYLIQRGADPAQVLNLKRRTRALELAKDMAGKIDYGNTVSFPTLHQDLGENASAGPTQLTGDVDTVPSMGAAPDNAAARRAQSVTLAPEVAVYQSILARARAEGKTVDPFSVLYAISFFSAEAVCRAAIRDGRIAAYPSPPPRTVRQASRLSGRRHK